MDDLKNENECLKHELHSLADQLQKCNTRRRTK